MCLLDECGEALSAGINSHVALVGFDGFVDEVVRVVDKRIDSDTYLPIKTIEDYGNRILGCKGLSGNLEMVTISRKMGGNGAIFAGALKNLGMPIAYVGSVGLNEIHPIFEELTNGSEVIGIAQPAFTDAVELNDGKLICSKLKSLNTVSWASVCNAMPPSKFAKLADNASLWSFNNWSMITHMNEIWQGILDEGIPIVNTPLNSKHMFIDLADPEKRTQEDIKAAMGLLARF